MADTASTSNTSNAIASTSSDHQPGAKIPRVKRACVRCFTSKVRCSGEQPTCQRCAQKSATCYYDPAGNSRTKRPRPAPATPAEGQRGESSPGEGVAQVDLGTTAPEIKEEASPASSTPSLVIRQPFFRWLGLTSVVPPQQGAPFRSLSIAVQERTTPPPSHPTPPPAPRNPAVESAEAEARVRTFYALFESYLPYMPLQQTLEQLARGTLSEVVLVSMSALVKRMRPETPGLDAEKLADRAKALIITHLALPSLDTVYALILISYHEHGADRDSGLWAYCGMAIRACIDLGLHKSFEAADPAETALRSRIFWAVACLDRILSCGTGRLTTIPLSQIEIPLPPPRENVRTTQGVDLPDPFPTLCRLLLILGNVSDAVNTLPALLSTHPQVPVAVQFELAEYQATLPPPLQFSIQTFSAYVNAGYAQCFLLLSVWHQAVHLAITQAALLFTQAGTLQTEHGLSPLSGSSAISIADMLAYSSVILSDAFLCTPTLSQPILMAGRAASSLLKTVAPTTPAHQVEPLERAVAICQKTLERMQQPWRGLSWHVESIVKNAQEVDFSEVGATIVTEDRGMFAKAKLDDLARSCSWLLDELAAAPNDGEVVGVGLSSWGMSTQPATTMPPPQSTVAVLRSGRSSPILWNDQSGGLNTFAQDVNGFWAGEWAAWQPGAAVEGLPAVEGLEDVLALPQPPLPPTG
ncbi:hypothetical protein JCM10207_003971 [Rhodosporidiobolus poonsookiae]